MAIWISDEHVLPFSLLTILQITPSNDSGQHVYIPLEVLRNLEVTKWRRLCAGCMHIWAPLFRGDSSILGFGYAWHPWTRSLRLQADEFCWNVFCVLVCKQLTCLLLGSIFWKLVSACKPPYPGTSQPGRGRKRWVRNAEHSSTSHILQGHQRYDRDFRLSAITRCSYLPVVTWSCFAFSLRSLTNLPRMAPLLQFLLVCLHRCTRSCVLSDTKGIPQSIKFWNLGTT